MSEQIRKSLKGRSSALRWLPVAAVASLFIQMVWAQGKPPFNTTVPSQIMDQFRNNRIQWTTNVFMYANSLFGILAVIEFAWSAAVMLLEKSDLQSWTSALIRKLMWIGAFYALLLNGRFWIPRSSTASRKSDRMPLDSARCPRVVSSCRGSASPER